MSSALSVISALLLSQAPGARILAVETARSTLGYRVVHKLHKVRGESQAVEAKAALSADGGVLLMARVAVASFKSGDANRDAHMQEVLETGRFPQVVLKGKARFLAPETYPAAAKVVVEGELDFHGRKRPLKVPLEVELKSADEVRVTGSFTVSLDEHEVERPSLLFMKIDDACQIDFDLSLKAEGK
ncbi:MAG: YceI family protein [Deltaproteobacteria bacterium]|nr:YceI family protein [Deltaproteobacteria bacterium]